MSESDSDLDFESADEDGIGDFNVENNNASSEELRSEMLEKDKAIPVESPDGKLCSEMPEEKTCTELPKETPLKLDNLQISDTHDTDKNVNQTENITENVNPQIEKFENYSKNTQVDVNNVDDNVVDTVIKTETSANKNQEKQRVTLRLEKKIQQKQQQIKDNSVENDAVTTSEISVKREEPKSSWGFGSWGTSLLSTAASSVSTFTNQVSQGIGTVLETVETTLGAPPPEELAAVLNERKASKDTSEEKIVQKENSDEREEENTLEVKSSILPNMSSWTKVLEDTGSKVLMGGLDTLELIGKKTINIITEGDPGLRKKRAAFSDGTTLSQILREAKDNVEESKEDDGRESVNYSQMFDEYQGLIHLEALEILSEQSDIKIKKLIMRHEISAEVKKQIEMIKSMCEGISDTDEPDLENLDHAYFVEKCTYYAYQISLPFNIDNIIKAHERICKAIDAYENITDERTVDAPQEMYHSAICSLAEFTAKSIEAFHKLAELILVQSETPEQMFINNLIGLTMFLCTGINNLASRYHHCIDSASEKSGSFEKTNSTIIVTNLYLEAENSKKYIQDAFLLLSPVLQACVLETSN